MSEYLIQGELMTALANEVRRLNGTSNKYNAAEIADSLQRIQDYTISTTDSTGQLTINNNDIEYFIQDDLMNAMAKEIRRISNTTSSYNALQMAEFLPRVQGTIGETSGAHWVRVVNHAGEVLEEQYLDEGMIYALPTDISRFSNVVPNGYVFCGWRSYDTLQDRYLVVPDHDVKIYPTFDTISGASEFVVSPGVTEVYLPEGYNANGEAYVDWGDGNITSPSIWTEWYHVYDVAGEYIIKLYNVVKLHRGNTPNGFTSVKLSSTVKEISSAVFMQVTDLTDIILPPSLISINSSTFSDCENLQEIFIPNGVTTIESNAFKNCVNLHSVRFPASLTSCGDSIFYNSNNITKVDIEDITSYCNINAGESWYSPMYQYRIANSRPSVSIQLYVDGQPANHLTIPYGITTVPKGCFANCTNICDVTIPDTLTIIQDYAFRWCENLAGVYITDLAAWCNIDFNNVISNPLYYAKKLYVNNQLVTNLVIPNSVTSISIAAFYNCESLTSVTIPNSITSIGTDAFYNCKSLTGVYITDLAAWCNIDFSLSTSNPLYYAKKLYVNNQLVTNLVIPNSVTSIGWGAFYNCTSLTSVTIPDSVTSIGGSAFADCTSLTSVTIPDSVTSIGGSAFYRCIYLADVTIPSGITSIAANTFYGCSITSITIPDSVTSIGNYAFAYCMLTSIAIPDSVTSIGNYAFAYGTLLRSARFTDTNGWSVCLNKNSTPIAISSSQLSSVSNAATLLTDTYRSYIWTKS